MKYTGTLRLTSLSSVLCNCIWASDWPSVAELCARRVFLDRWRIHSRQAVFTEQAVGRTERRSPTVPRVLGPPVKLALFSTAFAELQTDITDLTADLESTGIPIFDHRTFVMKVFFPGVTDHPILADPKVRELAPAPLSVPGLV